MKYSDIQNIIDNDKKNGSILEQRVAEKIEIILKPIKCVYCLDTQEEWDWRGLEYRSDGNGDYYRKRCDKCCSSECMWIKDSCTNEMYGLHNIKLFHNDNVSVIERYQELINRALVLYPEIDKDEPKFNKIKKQFEVLKTNTYFLSCNIVKILNICKNFASGYFANIMSISSLLHELEMNLSSIDNINNKETILCEEIDDTNKFIYLKVINNSSHSKMGLSDCLSITEYNLDIQVYFYIIKPDNKEGYTYCKDIIDILGQKEMNNIKELFIPLEL